MGVYWMAVNVDRREAVNPSALGETLKRWWIDDPDSATRRRVRTLLAQGRWGVTDEIRALADGGYHEHLYGPSSARPADYDEDWIDVSTDQLEALHRSVHDDDEEGR